MWWLQVALGAPVSPMAATVPATGRAAHVFVVPEFGRYAVLAHSPQGTAVEVQDRMAGLLDQAGVPGLEDGRVDLFLDRGEIKVVAASDPKGTGSASLQLARFTEQAAPLRLEPERRIESAIRDLEVRSWWVDVPAGGPVALEAAGRYLADLQLWRDGVWLVDANLDCERIEPREGAPWTRCALSTAVEPGVYLASAYGGPGTPWSTDDDQAPLHVQWEVPKLGSAGQIHSVLPTSGFVRWQVPDGVDTAHVALPEVAPFRVTGPLAGAAEITSESRRPVATARLTGSGVRTLTLTGSPGQAYRMTWLRAGGGAPPAKSARFWVGSLSTADPADVPDLTGFLVDPGPDPDTLVRSATQALPASSTTAVSRTFNLSKETATLVEVTEEGPYAFWVDGLKADLALDPVMLGKTRPPPTRPVTGELHADLAVGLYSLRLIPSQPGVATLQIGYDSLAARAKRVLGAGPQSAVLRPVVQFPSAALTPKSAVKLAAPPGTLTGVFLRELPLDLLDALPVTLLPGEQIDVPVRLPVGGSLSLTTSSGTGLLLGIAGEEPTLALELPAGDAVVSMVNPTGAVQSASLALRREPAPLRPLEPSRAATLDTFPRLRAGQPVGVDLVDEIPRTVRLQVEKAGIYLVESTGLLATRGTVSTRVAPSLLEASSNGVGRNFQIGSFLGAGDYQLTAEALAPSAGHAGLRIRSGVVREGGEIRHETPARVTLGSMETVRHEIAVSTAGRYAIRHAGRAGPFACRLEDLAGWTVTGVPEQLCELELWLEAGNYVLLGLPDRVESKRTTTVRRLDDLVAARTGHGPFPLALNTPVEATWTEPKGDGERPSDLWELAIPADLRATVTLSPEMAGELRVGDASVARLVPGERWTGPLARGTAVLVVRGARRGTGVPYTLRVDATELVTGTSQPVDGDGSRVVAVGEAGVYTLESEGDADLRARLQDAAGRVLATSDDRPDDWNFRMSTRLEPGRYTLTLDTVAPGSGPRTVGMRAPKEIDAGNLESGKPVAIRPGQAAHVFALRGARPEVVVATATSSENAGIALEVSTPDGWRGLAVGTGREAVAVAWTDGAPVRVRVWSEDARGGEVRVTAEALEARKSLGGGWGALRTAGGAGQFAVAGAPFVCETRGAGCAKATGRLFAATEQGLILVNYGTGAGARRVSLAAEQAATLRLGATPQRLDLDEKGPVAVALRAATGVVAARVADTEAPILIAGSAALAVGFAGGRAVDAWGDGDAAVTAHRLGPLQVMPAGDGVHTWTIPAGGAVSLAVPEPRDLRVDLEAGLAVITGDGRGAWAEPATLAVRLPAARGPVVVVNPTASERLARIEGLPVRETLVLAEGTPYESIASATETWVLPVAPGPGTLHVTGNAMATWVRADGQVGSGGPFEVGPGGMLTLAVTPGPVLAWVEGPGGDGPTRPGLPPPAQTVASDAAFPLSADGIRLTLRPTGPSAFSLLAPCPLVARIEAPAGVFRTEVRDAGERVDVWVDGEASVAIRGLAGAALYGELRVSRSVPVRLGEGLGPDTLLSGGGTAWFSLPVTRPGPLGLGVRATAERVDAVLMDATGRELARGLVFSRDLEPGDYLLALAQPPGAPPVRARPVVVGLVAPPEGPPDEVIRTYLVGASDP